MNAQAPKYVIDTCSLIKLREDYPVDVFSVVWDTLTTMAKDGVVVSSSEVLDELKDTEIKEDKVLDWAEKNKSIFLPLDGFIQQKALEILSVFEGLVDLKKKKSSADAFVVATAMIYSCAVVTDERPTNNSNTSGHRVKIPDVCKHYKVRCLPLVEMLRLENIQYRSSQ